MDPDPAGDPLPGRGHGGQDDHGSSDAERGGGGGGGGAGKGSGPVVGGRAETEEPGSATGGVGRTRGGWSPTCLVMEAGNVEAFSEGGGGAERRHSRPSGQKTAPW